MSDPNNPFVHKMSLSNLQVVTEVPAEPHH